MHHLGNILFILLVQLVEIPVLLLSYIVVPVALLFCGPEDENLPRWARFWQTYDFGINGDKPWAGPEHANGKQNTYWWRLKWLLRNKTAEGGYSQGDEIRYDSLNLNGSNPQSIWADATNIGVARQAATYAPSNKSTGAGFNPTDANWRLVLRAWL